MPTFLSGRTNEGKNEPDFVRYDDSEKARMVWSTYLPNIHGYDLFGAAVKIAEECITSDTLDVRLDELVTRIRMEHAAYSVAVDFVEDPDAQGYQSNARRILEEH